MEYLIIFIIVSVIIKWILTSFVYPISSAVSEISNTAFVNEYIETNGIINPAHFVTIIQEGNNSYVTNVIIANDGIHFPVRGSGSIIIDINMICYYVKEGDKSFTNQTYSKGRKISVSKAVVGGLIAGPLGAVIGGVSGGEKLENEIVEHDNVCTYIYYNYDKNKTSVVLIRGEGIYTNLKLRFPYKEYSFINNKVKFSKERNNEKSVSITDKNRNLEFIEELPDL